MGEFNIKSWNRAFIAMVNWMKPDNFLTKWKLFAIFLHCLSLSYAGHSSPAPALDCFVTWFAQHVLHLPLELVWMVHFQSVATFWDKHNRNENHPLHVIWLRTSIVNGKNVCMCVCIFGMRAKENKENKNVWCRITICY